MTYLERFVSIITPCCSWVELNLWFNTEQSDFYTPNLYYMDLWVAFHKDYKNTNQTTRFSACDPTVDGVVDVVWAQFAHIIPWR